MSDISSNPMSLAISLFFVLNVLGNIPLFIGLLGRYDTKKQRMILIREFTFAFLILILFSFFGSDIFSILGISSPILGIGGGILLLLIAISMIFPSQKEEKTPQHEPILVPLATPILAGPGSIASVMLFSSKLNDSLMMVYIIFGTVFISFCIALLASYFKYALGEKGLIAIERLGGMIISLIAVKMITSGIIDLVKYHFLF